MGAVIVSVPILVLTMNLLDRAERTGSPNDVWEVEPAIQRGRRSPLSVTLFAPRAK